MDNQLEICQHLVSCGYAYFEYIDTLRHNLTYYDNKIDENKPETCLSIEEDYSFLEIHENNSNDYDTFDDDDEEINNAYSAIKNNFKSIDDTLEDSIDVKNILEDIKEIDIMQEEKNDNDRESVDQNTYEVDNESSFMKFCLNSNEVIEGTLCNVTGPTLMTLMIIKIGGIDITLSKDEMQTVMFKECAMLQTINTILPGKQY